MRSLTFIVEVEDVQHFESTGSVVVLKTLANIHLGDSGQTSSKDDVYVISDATIDHVQVDGIAYHSAGHIDGYLIAYFNDGTSKKVYTWNLDAEANASHGTKTLNYSWNPKMSLTAEEQEKLTGVGAHAYVNTKRANASTTTVTVYGIKQKWE